MGWLARAFRLSALTLGRHPYSFLQSPGDVVPMVPNLITRCHPRSLSWAITPSPGPEGEVVAVIGPPSPEADWQKAITMYLLLGTIPDDKTKT
jgi:hypothetical protein